ncbi:ABC transporter permease [Actinoalloteichus hymeniacidonis]|uniref:Transport permease protein n=1 Tax=Actinoalloteichus hymeniacidonis TaxID=340345 RepID=A0AAC9HNC2_9PSEU|nr:ABC transporter permease [Actinoalloteichus hymeniacidonis]AOS62440.1 ABC-type multidrug transport system, permease component [Actinoalloteichus hymeniacidonis]MBB5909529.1 lipooligosaccharide transport system permease protein [Actinoalloteichus hymeniacidonis]
MVTSHTSTAARARASTGRVSGFAASILLILEGQWIWYRLNWRSTVISSVLLPVLFLVALGMGMGALIEPSEATAGMDYLAYLAPAMLVVGAVQNGAGEATYPVLSGFKWQKNFWAVTATPITPAQLACGKLVWIALRLTFSGVAFLLVAALMGAVSGLGVLLALPFSVLTGMAFAAPVVALAAAMKGEGDGFNALFRFVVMPQMLFAGTFYPISNLPELLQPIAWITPLWHGSELARGAAFGTLTLLPTVGHLTYLGGLLAIGTVLSCRLFRKQLVV